MPTTIPFPSHPDGPAPAASLPTCGDPTSDLLRAYRLFQKMLVYPRLVGKMRELFTSALVERGDLTEGELDREARELAATAPREARDSLEVRNALVDLRFSRAFSDQDVENYINLARKIDRFQNLTRVVNREGATSAEIKRALKEFCEIPQGDLFISPTEAEGVRVALLNHFVSSQLPFIGIAKLHITIRDIDELLDHSYWDRRRPGRIGGKSAGLLLAYKTILPRLTTRDPELEQFVTMPESHYFNSGIFSDFIDHNGLHSLHSQKYKHRESLEEEYEEIKRLFEKASFPEDVVEDFRNFLRNIGEHPIILRSSSLLEDNLGFAFSGKYDSVFLANQGDLETRLREFIRGLKQVHVSTYGPAPIAYRRDRNLLDFDEKMAVLVQKVVGRRFGDYFLPVAAGVAFSRNPHTWTPRLRREDGLVRLVFGLGTRAVDRVGGDYPRMVPLGQPLLRPEVGAAAVCRYSQKMADVINLRSGEVETLPVSDLLLKIDPSDVYSLVSTVQGGHIAAPLFKTQSIDPEDCCLTFENLLTKTPMVRLIRKILSKLEEAQGGPVDVEFAWDDGKLSLLQCRPLAVGRDKSRIEIPPDLPAEDILFTCNRSFQNDTILDIEYLVYVDPRAYARLPNHAQKADIGRAVGRVNLLLEHKRFALLGPGRWGSNDIDLGVRVGYGDINHTLVLGEIAFDTGGVTPEVSFGTHFFNDLVEAEIAPIAIYPDEANSIFREEILVGAPNELASLSPELERFGDVLHVVHLPSRANGRRLHVLLDGEEGRGVGFLARPQEPEKSRPNGQNRHARGDAPDIQSNPHGSVGGPQGLGNLPGPARWSEVCRRRTATRPLGTL